MEGPTAERLRLSVQQPKLVRLVSNDTVVFVPRREMLWEQHGDTDGKWRSGAVLYSFGHPHHVIHFFRMTVTLLQGRVQLVFEATAEDTGQTQRRLRGHIALDNIDLGTWKEEQEQMMFDAMPGGGPQDPAGQQGFPGGPQGGFGGFGSAGGGMPPPPGGEGQDSILSNPCMGHCNFENSFCTWKNDQDDDFDWSLVGLNYCDFIKSESFPNHYKTTC